MSGSATKQPERGRRVPRILLDRHEAAESLGVSLSHFKRHFQPRLPCVYSGNKHLYRPKDLEELADELAQEATARR